MSHLVLMTFLMVGNGHTVDNIVVDDYVEDDADSNGDDNSDSDNGDGDPGMCTIRLFYLNYVSVVNQLSEPVLGKI